MIDRVLATCRNCSGDVAIDDLLAAQANDYGVILGWRHRRCGRYDEREVSKTTALALYQRNLGQVSRSTEEIMLDEWAVDLGSRDDSTLTVEVFTNQWSPRRH